MAAAVQLNLSFSEFIYKVAREAPISAKRRLPEKYFKAILTDKSALRFAAKATFEQKREFLAHLGIEQFVIMADVNKMAKKDIRDVLSDIDLSGSPSSVIRQLAEANIFISGNREFCYSLLHTSKYFHSKGYVATLELLRTGFHEKNWPSKLEHEAQKEKIDEGEAMKAFAKFTGAVCAASASSEIVADVDSETMRILLHLYTRKGYMSKKQIESECGATARQVHYSVTKCIDLMYLQKHPVREKVEYQITGNGILAVNRFIEKVIKMLDF